MTKDFDISSIARLVRQCESWLDEQSKDRQRALEYYNGEMSDLPPDTDEDGNPIRATVVSKDVRSAIKKLMPSIMRTLLGNERIVEYEPVTQEDEPGADQATEYVNHVVVPESGAKDAIYDAVFDALVVKTGILKWSAYEHRKAVVHEFSGLSDDDILGLMDDPAHTIMEHVKEPETDPALLQMDPQAHRHSFKMRRTESETRVALLAVPRDQFLMSPDAESIEDASIVGERKEPTRSDLVSMGYDKDDVFRLSRHRNAVDDDDRSRKGNDHSEQDLQTVKAMETVLIYEVYVKLDEDGDGIAEMYKIVFGNEAGNDGDTDNYVVLEMEPVDEAPYADVVAERDAHQFEGHSVFEDTDDVQRIKTALLRGLLDSLAWQNNPQPAVDLSNVRNPEAVVNPQYGEPVQLKQGADARAVLQFMQRPDVSQSAFQMLPYFDEVAQDRTGITDSSGGIDPAAFQGMTATTAQIMQDAGIAQAEMIVNSLTGGIARAFRGILKLVVAHHDKPRTLRLAGVWKNYNPAHWNAEMGCTVNVGLGAGSRERDMSVLQIVLGLQRELIASIGADNPYVKPEQLYNTLEKITETAGFPSATPYFTKPDPQEIAQKMAQAQQGGGQDVAAQKLQMQMQLEAAKAEASKVKEAAQMQADLQVAEAKRQADLQIASLKAQVDYLKHADKMALEAAKAGVAGPQVPDIPIPGALNG